MQIEVTKTRKLHQIKIKETDMTQLSILGVELLKYHGAHGRLGESRHLWDAYWRHLWSCSKCQKIQKNISYEGLVFHRATQEKSETIAQCIIKLRKLSIHCEYEQIMDQVIARSRSLKLCKNSYQNSTLTLKDYDNPIKPRKVPPISQKKFNHPSTRQ